MTKLLLVSDSYSCRSWFQSHDKLTVFKRDDLKVRVWYVLVKCEVAVAGNSVGTFALVLFLHSLWYVSIWYTYKAQYLYIHCLKTRAKN